MPVERVEVAVVGGGQAGLAISYLLTQQSRDHVVLEQGRVAESWRSRRWDSLRLIGPNWTLRLPGYTYDGDDPDAFMGKDDVVRHMLAYAASFAAPIREGVNVTSVERGTSQTQFALHTSRGSIHANQVVIATGALQRPFIPALAAHLPAGIAQLVPYTYRRPSDLPPGAILVVGSGQSGCQIAEELCRAGRPVYLSVTRSWGMARRYRGKDAAFWARATGWSQRKVADLPPGVRAGLPNPQLTGVDGGHDLTLATLARSGVTLVGRIQSIRDGRITFSPDLAERLAWAEHQGWSFLQSIDDHIRTQGLDAPEESPPACMIPPHDTVLHSPEALDIDAGRIGTVIWATGYRPDLAWIRLPVLDDAGYPIHRRGVTAEPGLYFLGLDWLHTAHSSQFGGMSDDATFLAAVMAHQ